MLRLEIFLFIALVVNCSFSCPSNPTASTPLGDLVGTCATSYKNRTYASFTGIPFAKPPVGSLRFEEPIPAEPWSGTLEANKLYSCIQDDPLSRKFLGTEDCLYLNVYVPRTTIDPQEKLEVLVHIHGGGYTSGSGHQYTNPSFIMDRDFILVTFNYRLAILGFLSTEDDVLPGNNGMKDQVLALKWIKDNIASFGGNPNSITLTGVSSGGSSVHFHHLSPISKGLFQRGYAISGLATQKWSKQEAALEKAKVLGAALNCTTLNTKEMIECLKERPADLFINAMSLFYGYGTWPGTPFTIVVEPPSKTAFISDDPRNIVQKKQVNDVPFISSLANNEGLYFSLGFEPILPTYDQNWDKAAQFVLDYNFTVTPENATEIAEKIRQFYGGKIDLSGFNRIINDRFYYSYFPTAMRSHAAAISSPVYSYIFNFKGSFSMTQTVTQDDQVTGTTHGDEILYIFTSDILNNNIQVTERDMKMTNYFLDMLELFAKTNKTSSFGGFNWEPVTKEQFKFVNITDVDQVPLKAIDELGAKDFWQDIGLL